MADIKKRVFLASAPAAGDTRVIASPFQFWFSGEDHLRLEGWNSLAGVTLQLHGRFLSEENEIEAFTHSVTLTSDRLRRRVDVPMGKGFLLNLVIVAAGAEPRIGQTYARASVIRGLTGATIILGTMLQGYLTSQQGLGWPGSPIQSSVSGPGVMLTLEPAAPAVGADIIIAQPANTRWRLITFFAELTTGAAAVTRVPGLAMRSAGAVQYCTLPTDGSQAASVVCGYTWGIGLGVSTPAGYGNFSGPLPDGVMLNEAGSVITLTQGLQAADLWNPGSVLVEEWLEVN